MVEDSAKEYRADSKQGSSNWQRIELLRHSELCFPHALQNCLGLLVCRQIHAETAFLPYELNTFSMLSPGRSSVVKFLGGGEPSRRERLWRV